MPLVRCLTCHALTPKGTMLRGHCRPCGLQRKQVRNRSAAHLGPCPQDGVCWSCGEPARAGDPLTWGHLTPISQGGTRAEPQHLTCNSSLRDR